MTFKVLCTDGFSQTGIDALRASPDLDVVFEKALSHEQLLAMIPSFHGLIVRSASKVSRDVIEAGEHLQIVARAGVGIDNIDLAAATERGIFVVNAPAGNTTSTAELAFSMLLSLARHIPQAAASMARGEWEKKKFLGTEIAGKVLGIVGMGRIGREVARRARAFGMRVIAHDPYLTQEQCEELGARPATVEEICRKADFLTVHAPLTAETENCIAAREIALMKRTACIINCARGGIVNEEDLAAALREGRIAGAALDVFTSEPYEKPTFQGVSNVILTPHLGASTREAQDAVAVEAAQAVAQFFSEGVSFSAVNVPHAGAADDALKGQLKLAEQLGRLAAQLSTGDLRRLVLVSTGGIPRILTQAAIAGALAGRGHRGVSLVNAAALAAAAGVALAEEIAPASGDCSAAFGIRLEAEGVQEVWGGVLSDGTSKVVQCEGYRVSLLPRGPLLFIHNSDRPGVIGKVSSILGEAGINIAEMQNVRRHKGADALTVIRIDEGLPDAALEEIRKTDGVTRATLVVL